MSVTNPLPSSPILNLTDPSPFGEATRQLLDLKISKETRETLEGLTAEEHPRPRFRHLAETLPKLEVSETVALFQAAGKSSALLESPGIRFLFGFLEVKRPGVEVLRQLESLSNFQRVWFRILAGCWTEPEESEHADSLATIHEVLEEGARIGLIQDAQNLPADPDRIRAAKSLLQEWFGGIRVRLELGHTLSDSDLHFLTHLAMVEITLLERRLSSLASSINPYDVRSMGRLLPVLSRYDQDIYHMKSVMSRLATNAPFHERLMTIELELSSPELDKVVRALSEESSTKGLGQIVSLMREDPVLIRPFAYLSAMVHRIATLRARGMGEPVPDVHGLLYRILQSVEQEAVVQVGLEPEIAELLWPTLGTWGVFRPEPDILVVPYLENHLTDFIGPDGTPRFSDQLESRDTPELSLRQLVNSQMQHDLFLIGILENPKAVTQPGIVELIASSTRSMRVLDKICRMKSLYTGMANKGVPAALLKNPTPMPITRLRRFIHVRFVSKVDLRRIIKTPGGLRPQVLREITTYLNSLRL